MAVPLQIVHLTEQQERAQQAMEQLSEETTAARDALLKALHLRSSEWQQQIATPCSCTPAAQQLPDLRVHYSIHAALEHCSLTELPATRQPDEVLVQHVSATSLLRGRSALLPGAAGALPCVGEGEALGQPLHAVAASLAEAHLTLQVSILRSAHSRPYWGSLLCPTTHAKPTW